jgi:glutamyl-tRNA synthetase
MNKKVRVRFAPSPTGGLHLGGIRTVLYNYLFAKKNEGQFILRLEDTDQSRFVEGAEQYIYRCLNWCGLMPDESPLLGGPFAPYKQSERKANGWYRQYAEQLVAGGFAYYAFDTPEELEKMRQEFKTEQNPNPQYDGTVRMKMKNSLCLPKEETENLLKINTPYVIRIRIPSGETISFTDMVRGVIKFESNSIDDKVLLKRDGMPTYHLAVVVDDYMMQISHAFRGEEWLPSAPVHILLWKYLGWEQDMPQWAHLPLLGPNGKLSKRDGATYGFPVFAMNWEDKASGEITKGFKEQGFLPEAFINLLAVLGWNNGTEQEIFSLNELIAGFEIERVHSAGARFDYEKAKWFNHQWILQSDNGYLADKLIELEPEKYKSLDKQLLTEAIGAVKERCHLLTDFWPQLQFFFEDPNQLDTDAVKGKWTPEKADFFDSLIKKSMENNHWEMASVENIFKNLATEKNLKPGELQLPFRLMLVGGKFGPNVFQIAGFLGKDTTIRRIRKGLETFNRSVT